MAPGCARCSSLAGPSPPPEATAGILEAPIQLIRLRDRVWSLGFRV